jgi:hypothetical protein
VLPYTRAFHASLQSHQEVSQRVRRLEYDHRLRLFSVRLLQSCCCAFSYALQSNFTVLKYALSSSVNEIKLWHFPPIGPAHEHGRPMSPGKVSRCLDELEEAIHTLPCIILIDVISTGRGSAFAPDFSSLPVPAAGFSRNIFFRETSPSPFWPATCPCHLLRETVWRLHSIPVKAMKPGSSGMDAATKRNCALHDAYHRIARPNQKSDPHHLTHIFAPQLQIRRAMP